MYILFITFFASLFGIIFMIGRKLAVSRNGQINENLIRGKEIFEFPYIREIRQVTLGGVRKFGHISLVVTLRFYIRSSNSLKNKYEEIKLKIKSKGKKGLNDESAEKEANRFLRMISDYKLKIRKIKQKIREEENNS